MTFLQKRLNITSGIVEQGSFDISSMSAGYKLTSKEYQKGIYEGENFRNKVLWRDHYSCQRCNSNTVKLEAHHITYKSKGGTNAINNGVCLCHNCHIGLHNGLWNYNIKTKHFKYPTHLMQGKWFLFDGLKKQLDKVEICYGWMTSKARKLLKLDKDHYLDASAMLNCNNFNCTPFLIKPRRKKIWENNPSKKCTEKNGFRHFDLVKAKHRTRGIVIGSIRSLKMNVLTIRTSFNNNFSVSYKKSILIERPRGLIFTQIY